MRAGRAPRIRLRRVTSARRDECRIGNWFGRALGLFKSFLLDGDKNEDPEGQESPGVAESKSRRPENLKFASVNLGKLRNAEGSPDMGRGVLI
ncbi:hypothetical protein L596_001012 [Steinernema carpocapsae]|uniref:Uncharacterized protein n=1 Tax=Steinernema carpocapsae TaxID=34508 RepID=A0A4U8UK64_STECR|nr:hypothetical protein L596_001012 [Steinernema carpocapsae]